MIKRYTCVGLLVATFVSFSTALADIDRGHIFPHDILLEPLFPLQPLPPPPPTPYEQCLIDSTKWFNDCLDFAERDGNITDEEALYCADTVDAWQDWCKEQFGPQDPPVAEPEPEETVPVPLPVPDPNADGECPPEADDCEEDMGQSVLEPPPGGSMP